MFLLYRNLQWCFSSLILPFPEREEEPLWEESCKIAIQKPKTVLMNPMEHFRNVDCLGGISK